MLGFIENFVITLKDLYYLELLLLGDGSSSVCRGLIWTQVRVWSKNWKVVLAGTLPQHRQRALEQDAEPKTSEINTFSLWSRRLLHPLPSPFMVEAVIIFSVHLKPPLH